MTRKGFIYWFGSAAKEWYVVRALGDGVFEFLDEDDEWNGDVDRVLPMNRKEALDAAMLVFNTGFPVFVINKVGDVLDPAGINDRDTLAELLNVSL